MATGGARTAARTRAQDWHAHAARHGRFGSAGAIHGIPGRAAAIGLDRWPQRADRHALGANDADRRRYAGELVTLSPDVILASATPATLALQQATRTIPIVFANVADPVGAGIVESLAQPLAAMSPGLPCSNIA